MFSILLAKAQELCVSYTVGQRSGAVCFLDSGPSLFPMLWAMVVSYTVGQSSGVVCFLYCGPQLRSCEFPVLWAMILSYTVGQSSGAV